MSLSRRMFLRVSATASGGMLVAFQLPGCKKRKGSGGGDETPGDTPTGEPPGDGPAVESELNAWVYIAPDDTITIRVDESEMGQGVLTALPMIIVEELRGDWSKVRSEHASLDPRYGHQSTGGSTSVRLRYTDLREVGATAREMLIAAAAAEWSVAAAECQAENSVVTHPSGKRASFGQLAARAAALEPPAEPKLVDEASFRIIGKPMKRLDTRAKVDGSAVYGIDVRLPGMLVASVEHCPIFGGSLASVDASAAKAVPGVIDVLEIPTGVAVVAEHFYAAQQGRQALRVTWNPGAGAGLSNESIRQRCQAVIAGESAVSARADGDVGKALSRAKKVVRATYEAPYLAHAPMETLGATARFDAQARRVELWLSTQAPSSCARVAAEIAGVDESAVTFHPMMLGGGFGRRSQTDFLADAVHLARALPGKPIKVVWTREDGVRGGMYRPYAYNQLEAGVDAKGALVGWRHRIASPSILEAFGPLEGGIDESAIEGAASLPYQIGNIEVTYANPELPISLWFWRSVGHSQNAYVTECFFDEVARAAGRDPFELRRELLADHPRHRGVLERAAEMAGWGTPVAEGRARGIAVHESFGSFVAEVAEVSLEGGVPRVHKVFCAVDCGRVVNPDTIVAQMESGIVYGLSAALYGRIDIAGGRAVQSNFHDYEVLRMAEMPAVETAIIDSREPHGGIGEPGVPPIAPAVCNALLALTGKPVRKLPLVG